MIARGLQGLILIGIAVIIVVMNINPQTIRAQSYRDRGCFLAQKTDLMSIVPPIGKSITLAIAYNECRPWHSMVYVTYIDTFGEEQVDSRPAYQFVRGRPVYFTDGDKVLDVYVYAKPRGPYNIGINEVWQMYIPDGIDES